MAEQHSKSEEVISKVHRRYTVGYLPNSRDTPAIKLSGREAGFQTGTGVAANIEGECIRLIPHNPQEEALLLYIM